MSSEWTPSPVDASQNLPSVLANHPSRPKLVDLLQHPTLWDPDRKWGAATALAVWLSLETVGEFNGEVMTQMEPSTATWIAAYDLIPSEWRVW